ncbi:translocase of chloroplast 159, chloroplastic-like [Andrographis paniculata]|uniref:translocase of chloroplast 159, chloroplastic-like n=1 Tax=Andrographis paniculata TaxID=175694 RepID=UPI0021E8CC6B|nr:translocase of chloroplast 159, chloroplastic-like [Andrographis paniculata]
MDAASSASSFNKSVDNDGSDGRVAYLSGEEEFEAASDKPLPVGDEGEGEGGSDDVPLGGKSLVNHVESKGDDGEDDKGNIEHADNGGQVSESEVNLVVDGAAVESEKSSLVDDTTDVELAAEGDSTVQTTHVDVVHEGEGNGPDTNEVAEADVAKPIGSGDAPKGDSIVDSIEVDLLSSGAAVVGEGEGDGGNRTEEASAEESVVSMQEIGADYKISEPEDVNKGDGLERKPLEPEIHASGEESLEKKPIEPEIHASEEENLEKKPLEPEIHASEEEKDGQLDTGDAIDGVSSPAIQIIGSADRSAAEEKDEQFGTGDSIAGDSSTATETIGSADRSAAPDIVKKPEVEHEPADASGAEGNGVLEDVVAEESEEGDTDGLIFGSSEAAKKFMEELEQGSSEDSHAVDEGSFEHSQRIDGQIITDSEEGDTEDEEEGEGKELFDSAALAALLKAATGSDSDSGNITITSRDGTRLFSVERPAGLGSSLRSFRPGPQSNRPNLFSAPTLAGSGESEGNLSEEEKKKLEKLQKIRVNFLRLLHRLGLSPDESVAAQVLYRLALLGGRQGIQNYSLDAAKRMASQLESENKDDLDFSVNILVLGKSGVGKSATINSIFGEEKAPIDAFNTGTNTARDITGFVDGVKVRLIDTPGLKTSAMEQSFNRAVLSSVKKLTSKSPIDVLLYVDRLDAQTRDLNDLPLLKTIAGVLGPSIWRSAVVTLTHAASAPPDGPNGNPLSYEMFVSQRSHVVQQSIGHAAGDLRMMSPSLMNPVSLVENHPSCRKNREGQKILPNGQSWRPQLLLLCYSMKILSEANSISKPQDPFDHRKLFGFRARVPPLPYMLSSMLQSRPHPKLPSDQGGENADSDIDLDEFSDSDGEEEDEYDQLPPFKPLKKAQMAKLSKEQRRAYFEEYDYRVKLLQKKQWKEELRRMKEFKKRGKDAIPEEEDADSGAAAPVAVPLPDMALPPTFDGDNPAYRYRFLEPTTQFLARPVLDNHGWDHDCGYDGVNLEHSLAIANRFPVAYTIQITKDKKDFTVSLDSSVSLKHGEDLSSMAGFDIQSMGKQLAYILRGETKVKSFKKHKAAGGISVTFLGENVVPGVKVEDQITLGKQYVVVGSAGAVRSQQNTAYGANFELQRREVDYPIGQVQSTLSMSIIKWRGDLALGFNSLAQFSIGRNSKVAVRAGINNKLSGQVTVRTSTSEHLSLALAAILPTAISIYKKLVPGAASAGEKYSIY